ncbi:hypothetical protein ACFFRR_002753 [Megaselia abdita]
MTNALAQLEICGKLYSFKSNIVYTVGSCDGSDGCEMDVTIPGSSVDHKHAAIDMRSKVVKVFDLVSQFGTYVDDQECDALDSLTITQSCPIKFGAVIGQFTLFRKNHPSFGSSCKDTSGDIISASPEKNNNSKSKSRFLRGPASTQEPVRKEAAPIRKSLSQNDVDLFSNRKSLEIPATQFLIPPTPENGDEDDCFIPETQQIMNTSGEGFDIPSEVMNENVQDPSQNLLAHFQESIVIPRIVHSPIDLSLNISTDNENDVALNKEREMSVTPDLDHEGNILPPKEDISQGSNKENDLAPTQKFKNPLNTSKKSEFDTPESTQAFKQRIVNTQAALNVSEPEKLDQTMAFAKRDSLTISETTQEFRKRIVSTQQVLQDPEDVDNSFLNTQAFKCRLSSTLKPGEKEGEDEEATQKNVPTKKPIFLAPDSDEDGDQMDKGKTPKNALLDSTDDEDVEVQLFSKAPVESKDANTSITPMNVFTQSPTQFTNTPLFGDFLIVPPKDIVLKNVDPNKKVTILNEVRIPSNDQQVVKQVSNDSKDLQFSKMFVKRSKIGQRRPDDSPKAVTRRSKSIEAKSSELKTKPKETHIRNLNKEDIEKEDKKVEPVKKVVPKRYGPKSRTGRWTDSDDSTQTNASIEKVQITRAQVHKSSSSSIDSTTTTTSSNEPLATKPSRRSSARRSKSLSKNNSEQLKTVPISDTNPEIPVESSSESSNIQYETEVKENSRRRSRRLPSSLAKEKEKSEAIIKSSEETNKQTRSRSRLRTKEVQSEEEKMAKPEPKVAAKKGRPKKEAAVRKTISEAKGEEVVQKITRRRHTITQAKKEPTSRKRKSSNESDEGQVSSKKVLKSVNIVFTGIMPDMVAQYKQTLSKFNVTFENDITKCDVLITPKVARTQKLLYAMAKGIPVLSTQYLETIVKFQDFPNDLTKFFLRDADNENKYKFNMPFTIEKAQTDPVFNGLVFYMTPDTFPDNNTLRDIITAAGGKVFKGHPKVQCNTPVILVSSEDDDSLWKPFKKTCSDLKIINGEGIMSSIMRYKLCFDDFIIT